VYYFSSTLNRYDMIDIQNIHFRYKRKPVFSGLDLKLEPGHIYGLLGKNGTGKSTLLRSLAGLLPLQKGMISAYGHHPFERDPVFLQQVFMVPEEFYLPDVSVSKYIASNAPFYPSFSPDQMEAFLKEFEVPVGNSLQQMSYGQKKKVLISFALACNTKVLLLDEPTNGLDILSKSQFRKIIASASSPDKCILISTHQVKDLENLIDRVLVMDEGRIVFDHSIDNINERLICRISYDKKDLDSAIYADVSLSGHAVLVANDGGQEGNMDLEMLYKAIVTNGDSVRSIFNKASKYSNNEHRI
jgi:ABC-2 type transport system ATP-binding protein